MGRLRRLRRTVVLAGAIGVAVALGAAPASADPAAARKHFELGKRYFQVEEMRKAIEEFKAAHIEEPDPAFLYNIAECYRRLGEAHEAIAFYRRYLSLTPQSAPLRGTAAQHISELEAASPKPPPATAPATAPAAITPPPVAPVAVMAPPPLTPAPAPAPGTTLTAATSTGEQDGESVSRPFYKRAWFYGVVGAVVVGAAVGIWALSASGGTSVPGTALGNQTAFGR